MMTAIGDSTAYPASRRDLIRASVLEPCSKIRGYEQISHQTGSNDGASTMARRPKQKLLTSIPGKFYPDFIDRLNGNYAITEIIRARREALIAHCGGGADGVDIGYVKHSLIKRTIWLELIAETYEQRFVIGEEIDIGALTQVNNTLKGLYKDLQLDPEKQKNAVRDALAKYDRRPATVEQSRPAA